MSATDNSKETALPCVDGDEVSTGAAADSADWDERLKGLPRLLRYAMLVSNNGRHIEQRLIAEIDELCPRLPNNVAWTAAPSAETGIALAAQLDRLAVTQNEPTLRSLADCVRLLSLPVPRDELAKARETMDEQVAARLEAERDAIRESEAKKARSALADDLNQRDQQLADLQNILAINGEKLAAAQKAEAEMLRKTRELDDAKREVELTVEKRVQENLMFVREKARLEADDGLKAKVAEKEAQIAGMKRQIDELRRKAEQGSQQIQGEALEIELEARLRARFQSDQIEPVPKGEFGGDVLHRVLGTNAQPCGTILWESKRAKNWSAGWLSKLRDDQRAASADLAMLVTSVLPNGVESFDLIDNVWVVEPRFAIPLAMALRQSLVDIAPILSRPLCGARCPPQRMHLTSVQS